VQEELTTCKFGAQTQDGSKSSFMLMNISVILKTRNALMLLEAKMKKDKKFKSMEEPTMQTKDGRSSIKINMKRFQPRVSIKSLVLRLTDHSILSQTSQSIE
jgi:hypothetical protein